jgi:type II secretory pathway component PulF
MKRLFNLSVNNKISLSLDLEAMQLWYAKLQFDTSKRLFFYNKMQAFIEAGIAPDTAIRILDSRYRKRKEPARIMTTQWLERLRKGESLADAFNGWVPSSEQTMISAGDQSGNLAQAFSGATDMVEDRRELTREVMSHIRPSVTLLLMLTVVIYVFSSKVAPAIKNATDPTFWPPESKAFFAFGDFMMGYGVLIFGALMTLIILIGVALPRMRDCEARRKLDRLPLFSSYRAIQSAYLIITLSAMYRAGITIDDALSRIIRFSSPYVASHIRLMHRRMARGMKEGDAFDTGMFPAEMADDARDFSQTSSFAKGLEALGRQALGTTKVSVTKSASAAQLILKVFLYGYVFWTLASIAGITMSVFRTAQAL